MPGKRSFPKILVSGYSQEGISSFSRPGERNFQYPNKKLRWQPLYVLAVTLSLNMCTPRSQKSLFTVPLGLVTVLTCSPLSPIFFPGKNKLLKMTMDNLMASEMETEAAEFVDDLEAPDRSWWANIFYA